MTGKCVFDNLDYESFWQINFKSSIDIHKHHLINFSSALFITQNNKLCHVNDSLKVLFVVQIMTVRFETIKSTRAWNAPVGSGRNTRLLCGVVL